MDTTELIAIINRGEDSRHQFKAEIHHADALAAELVAFSNTSGGWLLVGVADDGQVVGLSPEAVDRLNQLIGSVASENVRPAITPTTENIVFPQGTVVVIEVREGVGKPYMDRSGAIWLKVGADKRKATSREELQRLFQSAGLVHADEVPVGGTGPGDIDLPYFANFFETYYGESLTEHHVPLPQLLANMNLARDGELNLAGALLFSRHPEFKRPAFVVKAVAFAGNDLTGDRYIDSRDIVGKLADVYQQCLQFVLALTLRIQGDRSVNSLGEPEIPRIVWEELLANALVHRNYFINAPIRLLIFNDRVEIINPGPLPNHLTIANIKAGNSNLRNPILASFAAKLLPYRGLGSGVLRALRAHPAIDFVDDREGNLFKAIVHRPTQRTA